MDDISATLIYSVFFHCFWIILGGIAVTTVPTFSGSWHLTTFAALSLSLLLIWDFRSDQSLDHCDSTPLVLRNRRRQTAARSQFRGLHKVLRIVQIIFILIFLDGHTTSCAIRGEGCVTTMDGMRADLFSDHRNSLDSAKHHGPGPKKIYESPQTSMKRKVCKRSFKRAVQRAERHGVTWYRGQLHTATQLGTTVKPPAIHQQIKNVRPSKPTLRQRFTCFSWNCNGLLPSHWDFLMMWLENQEIDILFFQETHWPFTRDWVSEKYMMAHSGSQSKQAGLLCMVSKRICSPSELTWYEHVPGRVLQLRIHGKNRCIDLINVYQYTCIPSHMDQRQQVWHQLFALLHALSKKNVLVLAGDFNCSTDQRSNAVGFPTFKCGDNRSHGPSHPDANHWQQLLLQFDLSALNTWNVNDTGTYEFCNQSSRIDYICTRRIHADQLARDVKHLREFSLVPITGAYHVPLLTSLRRVWFPAHKPPPLGWTRQQRLQLHQHCLNRDFVFDDFLATVHDTVHELAQHHQPDLTLLHQHLMQIKVSALNSRSTPDRPPRTDARPFKRFQDHTWMLRRIHTTDLAGLFAAWNHVCQRNQARKDMNLAAKQSRKQRLDQVFHAADQAEKAKDHFTLFQHIRSLAPKQPAKRIMLRSSQGELLGPDAAADWLQQWYQDLYSDGIPATCITDFSWPFTQQEFAQGLQSLPSNKALAPSFSPAPFWKYGAEPIAQFLDPLFHECCRTQQFPDSWGIGTVAMLVKPGKKGQHPSELRPIALLEPTGKTAMGLVTSAVQHQIQSLLNRLPQFAYARGRGTEDATHRFANHCRSVRQSLDALSHPIHCLKQGLPIPSLTGGMTLSLDLSRAFDMVDRTLLFRSMEQLDISTDLISLLTCVYNTTRYEFEQRGVFRSVTTRRGIRQGCRAAPCLWTVFISALMLDIGHRISPEFLLYCITIFADDICSHQIFHDEESFLTLLGAFGKLLDLIESAHLEVNLAKTTVTMRMRGRLVGKMQRRYVVRTKQGTFLKIPRAHGKHTLVRLVKSFRYLGVVFSYYNFEKETMSLRLKHSDQSAHQLHRWLYTQRMTTGQRVKLWYQCIFTCLRYGIIATGFTEVTLLSFYRFSIRQLRRILRDPVHLSHESNSDFLRRCQLPDPLLRLRDLCLQTASRSLKRHRQLAEDDILRLTPLPCYDHLLQVIERVHTQVTEVRTFDEVQSQHECPDCHHVFGTLAALRRHCTVAHGRRSGLLRLLSTQPATDTPTCPRCHMRFSTWHRYHYHVQYICTAALKEIDQVEHRLRVQELLQFARAHQVADLRLHATLLMYFLNRCVLCGKFHITQTGLMRHWNDEHAQTYKTHLPVPQFYCQQVPVTNPCQLCSISFAQYHRCIIWRQLAMLITARDLSAVYCDVGTNIQLVCDICGKAYTTKHGLAQHIQKFP